MLLHCVRNACCTACIFGKPQQIGNPLKQPVTFVQHRNIATPTVTKFCCLQMCNKILHPLHDLLIDIWSYVLKADINAHLGIVFNQPISFVMHEQASHTWPLRHVLFVTCFPIIIQSPPTNCKRGQNGCKGEWR